MRENFQISPVLSAAAAKSADRSEVRAFPATYLPPVFPPVTSEVCACTETPDHPAAHAAATNAISGGSISAAAAVPDVISKKQAITHRTAAGREPSDSAKPEKTEKNITEPQIPSIDSADSFTAADTAESGETVTFLPVYPFPESFTGETRFTVIPAHITAAA